MSAELLARIAELEAEVARLKGEKKKRGRPKHPKDAEIRQMLISGEKHSVISEKTGSSLYKIWCVKKELNNSRKAKE